MSLSYHLEVITVCILVCATYFSQYECTLTLYMCTYIHVYMYSHTYVCRSVYVCVHPVCLVIFSPNSILQTSVVDRHMYIYFSSHSIYDYTFSQYSVVCMYRNILNDPLNDELLSCFPCFCFCNQYIETPCLKIFLG